MGMIKLSVLSTMQDWGKRVRVASDAASKASDKAKGASEAKSGAAGTLQHLLAYGASQDATGTWSKEDSKLFASATYSAAGYADKAPDALRQQCSKVNRAIRLLVQFPQRSVERTEGRGEDAEVFKASGADVLTQWRANRFDFGVDNVLALGRETDLVKSAMRLVAKMSTAEVGKLLAQVTAQQTGRTAKKAGKAKSETVPTPQPTEAAA